MQETTMKNQINQMLEGVGLTVEEISNQECVKTAKRETERGFGSILNLFKDIIVGFMLGVMVTFYMTLWVPIRNIIACYSSKRELVKHVIKK